METLKTKQHRDEFSGLYDQLASFFGGEEVQDVLRKNYDITWEYNTLMFQPDNLGRAIVWMRKKVKETTKPNYIYNL